VDKVISEAVKCSSRAGSGVPSPIRISGLGVEFLSAENQPKNIAYG